MISSVTSPVGAQLISMHYRRGSCFIFEYGNRNERIELRVSQIPTSLLTLGRLTSLDFGPPSANGKASFPYLSPVSPVSQKKEYT